MALKTDRVPVDPGDAKTTSGWSLVAEGCVRIRASMRSTVVVAFGSTADTRAPYAAMHRSREGSAVAALGGAWPRTSSADAVATDGTSEAAPKVKR